MRSRQDRHWKIAPLTIGLALLAAQGVSPGSVRASILFVDSRVPTCGDGTSWATACKYLQDALATARASNGVVTEIWVAAGTYLPDRTCSHPEGTSSRAATFQLVSHVALRGGFTGSEDPASFDPRRRAFAVAETILSGDLTRNDTSPFANNEENCFHVVTADSVDTTAVLDGFTISGGNANRADAESSGGGILIRNSSPRVANCSFRGNAAAAFGGALSADSAVTLSECLFHNNTALSGGAIACAGTGTAYVSNCRLLGNSAQDGGAVIVRSSASPHLVNCVFSGNSASQLGGAVSLLDTSRPILTNCALRANTAAEGGAVYSAQTSQATLANCIVWGNLDGQGGATAAFGGQAPAVSYSCIGGGWDGFRNIANDPLFQNPDGPDGTAGTLDDNLRLQGSSPCIDAGNNGRVPPDAADVDEDGDRDESVPLDLDELRRFMDDADTPDRGRGQFPIVDMGPHEVQGLIVSAHRIVIPEAETAVLTVALPSDPAAVVDVTVSRIAGDPDVDVQGPPVLTFDSSNYAAPQEVKLTAHPDADYLNGRATIRLFAAGYPAGEVLAVEDDDQVPPATLFVNRSANGADNGGTWTDAFRDLQDALELASTCNEAVTEIWVAAGVYRPDRASGDASQTFQLVSGVAVYGGFKGSESDRGQRSPDPITNPTLLSGDLAGDDRPDWANNTENSYHIVTGSGTDISAVLDGFIVAGGNADAQYTLDNGGAGLLNAQGNPTVRNCLFALNASTWGAGMLNNGYSSPVVTHCAFAQNHARWGAGLYNHAFSSPIINDCTFQGNVAEWSGGIANEWYASPAVLRCVFSENIGSAMGNTGYCAPTVSHSTFSGNTAALGGGMHNADHSNPLVADCTFTQNRATLSTGGALAHFGSSSATLTRCTFIGNSAQTYGGGVSVDHSAPTFINCFFLGNTTVQGGGGLFNHTSSPLLVNCVFSGNGADFAAAIHNHVSNTSIIGCTLSGNSARAGGGVSSWYSTPVFINTILWGNWDQGGSGQSAQIRNNSGTASISYCMIQGWTGSLGGTGNCGSNPLLFDADGKDGTLGTVDDDLRLRPGSPAADHGLTSGIPADVSDIDQDGNTTEPVPTDIRGYPRVLGATVDIGAYEFSHAETLDLDLDDDIDFDDVIAFRKCATGPTVSYVGHVPAGCTAIADPQGRISPDSDRDGDVDMDDFGVFQACWTGPHRPVDPLCEP